MGQIVLPKKYHPDFRYPGVKPTGSVKINWNHKSAYKLKMCFLVNTLEIELYDLAQKRFTTISNAGSLSIIPTDKGISTDCNSSDDDHWVVNNAPVLQADDRYTIMMQVRYQTTDNFAHTILDNPFGPTSAFRMHRTAGLRHAYDQGFGVTASALLLDDQEWHNVGVTLDPSVITRFWIDNTFETTGASQAGNGRTFTLTKIGNADQESSRGFLGNIGFVYLWSRGLPDGEILELQADPYQFLEPMTPISYFIPDAAGGLGIPIATYHHIHHNLQ